MTAEEEKAAEYRRQCQRRKEFQSLRALQLQGSDYARRQLCLKTKPLLSGKRGDSSDD